MIRDCCSCLLHDECTVGSRDKVVLDAETGSSTLSQRTVAGVGGSQVETGQTLGGKDVVVSYSVGHCSLPTFGARHTRSGAACRTAAAEGWAAPFDPSEAAEACRVLDRTMTDCCSPSRRNPADWTALAYSV